MDGQSDDVATGVWLLGVGGSTMVHLLKNGG